MHLAGAAGVLLKPSKEVIDHSAKNAKQAAVEWPQVITIEPAEGIQVGEHDALYPEGMVLVLLDELAPALPSQNVCSEFKANSQ